MHYLASTLHDGTVLAAYPVRKPTPHVIKRDHLKIDEDGVAFVYSGAGRELSDVENQTRMRFQNIIATNLNTRRALRELVLPPFEEMRCEIATLRAELEDVKRAFAHASRG